MNHLFYGDNLDVLRQHVDDETIDLVYLDPPFNSNADYNVLFQEKDGTKAAAQIKAFGDTWEWDQVSAAACDEVIQLGGRTADALRALRTLLSGSDMMAYLAMMAPRLLELRRVLKPTGSLYLHCDPTASHYLKLLMDAVFKPQNFRNEIVWRRSTAHNDTAQGLKQLGRIHDTILFYTKSDEWTWNPQFTAYGAEYVAARFKYTDQIGRYKDADLTAAKPGGDTSYDWPVKRKIDGAWTHDLDGASAKPKGGWEYKIARPSTGRFWAYSNSNMVAFAHADRLHYFSSGMPRLKQYDDQMPGVGLQDLWTDIDPLNSQAKERLKYPTQKPEMLLDRIIHASSNNNDVVLDPFCGCGTTVASAQRLERRWIGIDITHLAITLIRHRLRDGYGDAIRETYKITGEPVSLPDAAELAASDQYQFQWWALGLVGARPTEQKKGADHGIDGRIFLHEITGGETKEIILSVKAGHTGPNHVSELRGVVDREKAIIGVLITMQEPTKAMIKEAADAGFYKSHWGLHPRLQILTVRELLDGRQIDSPPVRQTSITYRRAPRAIPVVAKQPRLDGLDAVERRMAKAKLPFKRKKSS